MVQNQGSLPPPGAVPRRRSFRRLALPAGISLGLVWLLSGCGLGVYLPLPEHAQTGKVDFRKWVGDASSSKPIRPAGVSRMRVLALLGSPDYQSGEGKIVGYVLRTYKGYYFAPLCFAGMGGGKWYRLQLTFSADDVLKDYQLTASETPTGLNAKPDVPTTRPESR